MPNEKVGPAIDLKATAPACIDSILCYLDDGPDACARSNSDTVAQWVNVTDGGHHVNCNGWDDRGQVYVGNFVDFQR